MFKQHDEEIFSKFEAAAELWVYLVDTVEEEEEGRGVDFGALGTGRVAGAGVAGGEGVAALDPLSLYQRLKATNNINHLQ